MTLKEWRGISAGLMVTGILVAVLEILGNIPQLTGVVVAIFGVTITIFLYATITEYHKAQMAAIKAAQKPDTKSSS